MSLPKIEINPSDIQNQFENFFNTFLDLKKSDSYTFESPIVIQFDQESDTKVFISNFFRNRNNFDDDRKILYITYYDGCDCVNLIDEPSNRYTISEIQKCSMHHLWLAYKQCETELSNTNL